MDESTNKSFIDHYEIDLVESVVKPSYPKPPYNPATLSNIKNSSITTFIYPEIAYTAKLYAVYKNT